MCIVIPNFMEKIIPNVVFVHLVYTERSFTIKSRYFGRNCDRSVVDSAPITYV